MEMHKVPVRVDRRKKNSSAVTCASAQTLTVLPTIDSLELRGNEDRPYRALVVDDDPINALLAAELLTRAGFHVLITSSGEEYLCLLAAGEGRVDVVLTDIHMPSCMSGFELLGYLKKAEPTLSVIVMTAEDGYVNIRRAMSGGAYGYLAKPFKCEDEVLQVVKSAADATCLKRANEQLLARLNYQNEQLQKMALTDQLTGIYNRGHIDTILVSQIKYSQIHGLGLSLIMFDIDHFKRINDEHGHQAGDSVLIHVANAVKLSIREIDSFGRYGGEEFLLVLPGTDPDAALSIAGRICNLISNMSIEHDSTRIFVTASFGVSGAALLTEREDATTLIRDSDVALYDAKESGRNQAMLAKTESALSSVHQGKC